jgi:alkylation response protein AidB-like acyl-CoA dehydrogenase
MAMVRTVALDPCPHILSDLALRAGLLSGILIGLPPIVHLGYPALKARIIQEVLAGKKLLCHAVTEAFSGSDIVGMRTRTIRTPDGKFGS